MANVSNAFDFNDSLAVFLAGAISDGTYDNIVTTLKFDEVGNEAVATQIDGAGGQLWSNLQDDYIHATYPTFYRATKTWRVVDNAARDALGSDDGLAVDDIGYTEDTNTLFYVVSVDGAAASTWMTIGAAELSGAQGVPLNDLIAYVDFGDRASYPGAGTSVLDFIGNLTAGTITGAAYADGALNFDGVSGDVTFAKAAAMDNIFAGGGTIMAFVRIRSDGEANIGEVVNSGFDGTGYKLAFDAEQTGGNGSVRVGFFREFTGSNGNWRTDDISAGIRAMPANSWASIAIVYDDGNVANNPVFYVNGKRFLDFTTVLTPIGTPVSDVGNPLILGNRAADDRTFDGNYQGFLAWDVAATPETISDAHTTFLARRGQLLGTNATGDRDAGNILIQGGDYYGSNDDNGGRVDIRGGSTTSGNSSSQGGTVEVRGGDTDEGGGGAVGNAIMTGGRGDQESDTRAVGSLATVGSEFGGATLQSGSVPAVTLFRGSDNDGTGPGGDAVIRGGESLATGSGNDNGGECAVSSGQQRNGGNPGRLLLRTGGPSVGTASQTGDLFISTQQTSVFVGDPLGAQGGPFTDTGNIVITTGPPGASAGTAGDISIIGGSTNAPSGNDPGSIIITAGGGAGADAGGSCTFTGGDGGATGDGGALSLLGGDGGATGGGGGDIELTPGSVTSGAIGAINLRGAVVKNAIVSPAEMAATENDYDPGGTWPAVNVIRLDALAGGTTLTGLDATDVRDGQVVLVINTDGADAIIFSDEDVGSVAGNRFALQNGTNIQLRFAGMLMLWYDGVSSRWRVTA